MMAGMNHRTGPKEEHRLESGVRDQMVHGSRRITGLGAQSHGHDHQAQLR